MSKRILLVDDDELVLESFEMIFTDLGYEVLTCSDSLQSAPIALASAFDLILVDIRMPGHNGAEVVRDILVGRPGSRVYVLTAYPGDPLVQMALEAGAQGVMKKPFEIAKILDLLKE
ncbi:MAG: response regulator [Spirochaetales bacterium]